VLQEENERLKSSYQNSVRNFQSLQGDFDKLHDEFDSTRDSKKKLHSDYHHSVSELGKIRTELSESKSMIESLNRKITNLEKDSEVDFLKRKELQSKIIILSNDLQKENSKLCWT